MATQYHRRKSGIKGKKYKSDLLLSEPFQWTEKQQEIIDLIREDSTKSVFIAGKPGTGKTHLTIFAGLLLLQQNLIEKVIYVRSIVEASHNPMGFLPGTLSDKEAPYMEVLYDTLDQILTEEQTKNLFAEGKLMTISTSFIRGKTMKNALVIVDEAQNLDLHSLTSLITRIGEKSKIIFIYDPKQSDLKSKAVQQDILKFNKIFDTERAQSFGIYCRQFSVEDIKRSEFCKFVVGEIEKLGS